MVVWKDVIVQYIKKIINELTMNNIKKSELLNENNHKVSLIINPKFHLKGENELIINTNNDKYYINVIKKIFGDDFKYSSTIKKQLQQQQYISDLNSKNNIILYDNKYYIQNIKSNSNTIFRAYSNSYYFNRTPSDNINLKNLGYYSNEQTLHSYNFKKKFVNYSLNNKAASKLINKVFKKIVVIDDLKDYCYDVLRR